MKVPRNTLCPCGSGKKYKKCCGSLLQSHAEKKLTFSLRGCGDCSACCQGWLTTRALDHDIYLDHPCPHCNEKGCAIHFDRPEEPCRNFFCAWAEEGSDLPAWMQPNLCNVIVLKNRMHWKKMPVDILVSAGKDPQEKLIKWFENRCRSENRALVYQKNNKWFGYGPQQFQMDMAEKINRGEALWEGSLIVK